MGPESFHPPPRSPYPLTWQSRASSTMGPACRAGSGRLSRVSSRGGPTTCSTSRAVYLLIASCTITHNNQLRHCQRNTHSWPC